MIVKCTKHNTKVREMYIMKCTKYSKFYLKHFLQMANTFEDNCVER